MSIDSIKIEGFKKFSNLELNLECPITLIYGENSSGKTSMLRALLGLAQTFSQKNKFQSWNAQGEYVDLGLYKDYIKNHDVKNKFSIAIRSSLYRPYEFNYKKGEAPRHQTEHKFTYEFNSLTDQARLNSFTESTRVPKRDELLSDLIYIGPKGVNYSLDESYVSIKIVKPRTRSYYHISADPNAVCWWFGAYDEIDDNWKKTIDSVSLPTKIVFDDRFVVESARERRGLNAPRMKKELFQRAIKQTELILSKLHYMGPLRMSPYRSYKLSAHTPYVGPNGETTPLALSYLYKKSLEDRTKNKIHKEKYDNFSSWFSMIFPDCKISVEQNDDVVRLKTTSAGRVDSISDVGFGFSQVLPILVQAAAMAPGETLIIEQPELHLHPKAQVAFAKFLTKAAKRGLKFIIETHSEHILKGLQLQISNHEVDENEGILASAVKIYYFHKDDNVTEMALNHWGEIEGGWPAGFFDESYNISSKILKNKITAMNERQSSVSSEKSELL